MSGVVCEKVDFAYPGEGFRMVIDEFTLAGEERVALVGPSGCGKTTLLRLIAGIFVPGTGRIRVGECEISSLPEKARARHRIRHIGLVFQEFELLDYLNVRDNIRLPYLAAQLSENGGETEDRVAELAEATGISRHLHRYPSELSQGERQRVALCRALVTSPELVLADEPTANLDPDNQARSVALLHETVQATGAGLIMVTHNYDVLGEFDRVVEFSRIARFGGIEEEEAGAS